MQATPNSNRTVTFVVPGKPFGRREPGRSKAGHTFPNKETGIYYNRIQMCFAACISGDHPPPHVGPVRVHLLATFLLAKSKPKWKHEMVAECHRLGLVYPCDKTPDYDNLAKSVGDALKGIAWRDDGSIYLGEQVCRYGPVPGLTVHCTFEPPVVRGDDLSRFVEMPTWVRT